MAKAETRPKEEETTQAEGANLNPSASPLERMADLTRRIIQVPKSEVMSPRAKVGKSGHK